MNMMNEQEFAFDSYFLIVYFSFRIKSNKKF